MSRIIAAVNSETLARQLQQYLGKISRFDSVTAVFDELWESDSAIDCVIIAGYFVSPIDISLASISYSHVAFYVLDDQNQDLSSPSGNINIFASSETMLSEIQFRRLIQ